MSNNGEVIKEWKKGVSECEDVQRKEELDWGQIYLARKGEWDHQKYFRIRILHETDERTLKHFETFTENAAKSTVKWELDLSDTKMSVMTIELDVNSTTYENGRVIWQLCGGNSCLLPSSGNAHFFILTFVARFDRS